MAEEIPPGGASQIEPLSALWRVLSAPHLLLFLMGALALILALTTWIPQIPPQISGSAQAWLAQQPGFWSQNTGLVQTLGLYDVYNALWLRLLLAVLALVLFVRLVDAGELAWQVRQLRHQVARPLPAWQALTPAVKIVSVLPAEEVRARVHTFLSQNRLDVGQVEGLATPTLIAGRQPLGLGARAAGYGALLLALVGLFLAGTWGWQSAPFQLVPGESRPVGHGTPYEFRLDAFRMQIDRLGRLAGYKSEITWLRDQEPAGEQVVAVGQPARVAGVALHQVGFAPAIRVRGSNARGQPLLLQGGDTDLQNREEIEVRFASAEDQPLIFVPELNRFLALVFEPTCDLGRPVVHVDLLDEDGAGRQRLASLVQNGTVPVDSARLDIDIAYLPLLRLDSRPGMGLALAAAGLALLALAVAWVVPVRLIRLTFLAGDKDVVRLEIAALPGVRQKEWLAGLGAGLQKVLDNES